MQNPLTIAERVFEIVERFPDCPALETLGSEPLTIADLWALASSHAERIQPVQGQVALCLPRSAEWVAAILGCWMLGKAPVILDPDWPQLRREKISKEADVKFIITEVVPPSETPLNPLSLPPETPAYIIYSSGSTGQPKGIVVPHAGLVPMLEQQIACFKMDHLTRSLWLHGIAFDASISDIGTALLARSTLCLDPQGLPSSDTEFFSRIASHKITHIDIPPALLAVLNPQESPPCLRALVIGGSVCPAAQVRKWAAQLHLVNVYGPTEATVCTSMITCSDDWNLPLIGKPIEGISYKLVDKNGQSTSEGELLISGHGVALEYLNQPELTRLRFSQKGKIRSFRSGDHVKETEQGDLVFLGRIDRQFKQNGKLICPEEIEAALLSTSSISQAHVAPQGPALTAWIIPTQSFDLEKTRSEIRQILPAWMVPSHWIPLTRFPTLSNGKIDIQSLTQAHQDSYPLDRSSEGQLTQLLRNLLGLPGSTSTDDFFFSGGDSLSAMQFLAGAEKLGINLPPDCLYQHRTIRRICQHLHLPVGYACKSSDLLKKVIPISFSKSKVTPAPSPPKILLTGATGFLGSAVLGEILARTNHPVTCLVRGNLSEKRKLIAKKLQFHGYQDSPRILLIKADLEKPHFGLRQTEWTSLSKTCTHLIHCGASIHSLAPFQDLEKTNVAGTATILELQEEGIPKRLIYASTLSVFVDATPIPKTCSENDLLTTPSTVYGGYAQTKWVAEKLVQQSPLPTHILRFGLLTANQATGYSAPDDSLTRRLSGTDLFPHPNVLAANASFDFTPVDYAASVLVDVFTKDPMQKICHIANPQQLKATSFYQAIEASNFKLQMKTPLPQTSPLHQTSNLFKTGDTRFSTTNTKAIQSTPCPVPTHHYMVQFLNRMHANLTQQ